MIAYEIQLLYAIRDKSQSEKKFEKKTFCWKKIVRKKIGLGHCLGFPVCKVICLGQIDAIMTKRYIHTATSMFSNLDIIKVQC